MRCLGPSKYPVSFLICPPMLSLRLLLTDGVVVEGIEFGRGTARTKMDAKELAAEMALRALIAQSSAA